MGRDKAGVRIGGVPLWQRQLATLRSLDPAELFISGKCDGPYAGAGVDIVLDDAPGLGPLAGIAAALRRATSPLVLVLAVDLPAMTPAFLSTLIAAARGVVPRSGGFFEPLAAVYPRACFSLAEACLRGRDHSMQHFIRLAVERGFIGIREITAAERALFQNVNTPGGLDAASGASDTAQAL